MSQKVSAIFVMNESKVCDKQANSNFVTKSLLVCMYVTKFLSWVLGPYYEKGHIALQFKSRFPYITKNFSSLCDEWMQTLWRMKKQDPNFLMNTGCKLCDEQMNANFVMNKWMQTLWWTSECKLFNERMNANLWHMMIANFVK